MTTEYFLGNEPEDFFLTAVSGSGFINTAGLYDSNFTRGATFVFGSQSASAGTVNFVTATMSAASSSCWTAALINWGGTSTNVGAMTYSVAAISWFSSTGANMFQVLFASSSTAQLQSWNGTSWANLGSAFNISWLNFLNRFDLQTVIAGSGGAITLYLNGTMVAQATGNTNFGSTGDIKSAAFRTPSQSSASSPQINISQVMILDEDTRFQTLGTIANDATGTTNAWAAGTYTDVNETTLNDSTLMYADAANELFTFSTANPSTVASRLQVQSLTLVARAALGQFGPQNLKPAVHTNGSDGVGANVTGLGPILGRVTGSLVLNPVTGLKWTAAEMAALEIGWKSAA